MNTDTRGCADALVRKLDFSDWLDCKVGLHLSQAGILPSSKQSFINITNSPRSQNELTLRSGIFQTILVNREADKTTATTATTATSHVGRLGTSIEKVALIAMGDWLVPQFSLGYLGSK